MTGEFWELVGLTSSYSRAPGLGTPAGPNLLGMFLQVVQEMVRFARPLECRAYATLSFASVETDGLPADFLDWYGPRARMTIAGQPIDQVDRAEVEMWRDSSSAPSNAAPCVWYEAGRQTTSPFERLIGLYPVPSTTVTPKIHYLRKPLAFNASGLTGSSEYPDIPVDFHEIIVFKAVHKFYQRRKEVVTKDIGWLLAEYNAKMPMLKQAVQEDLRPNYTSSAPNDIRANLEAWA